MDLKNIRQNKNKILLFCEVLLPTILLLVFSEIRVTRSLVLCVCFVNCYLSFCPFSFDHCVFCPFLPFGIFKLFLLDLAMNNTARAL